MVLHSINRKTRFEPYSIGYIVYPSHLSSSMGKSMYMVTITQSAWKLHWWCFIPSIVKQISSLKALDTLCNRAISLSMGTEKLRPTSNFDMKIPSQPQFEMKWSVRGTVYRPDRIPVVSWSGTWFSSYAKHTTTEPEHRNTPAAMKFAERRTTILRSCIAPLFIIYLTTRTWIIWNT